MALCIIAQLCVRHVGMHEHAYTNVRLHYSSCASFVLPFFHVSFNFFSIPPFHNMFAPCLLILSIIVYFYANNSCYKIFIIPPLTMLLYALLFSYNLPGDFSPPGDAVAAFSAMGDLVGAICFHRTAMTCAVGSTECGGVVGASSSAQFLCRSPNGS